MQGRWIEKHVTATRARAWPCFRAAAVLIALGALSAGPARGDDWPQFRGPKRDGKSAETGLLQSWPAGGPKRLWENGEIGHGWASLAVVGGTVYTTGVAGNDLRVSAVGPDGKLLWQKKVDAATNGGGYKGARCTPTVVGDLLYVLSDAGTLACLKTADGATVWSQQVLAEFAAPQPTHCLGESPLVVDEKVLVAPGGKAAMASYDRKTGKRLWASEAVDGKTAYASAILVEHGGLRQAVTFSAKSVFGVNVETGHVLWKEPQETQYEVNASPAVFAGGVLFAVSGEGYGGQALRLDVADGKVRATRLWTEKTLDDYLGGVVLVDGKICGTGWKNPGLKALDFATGKRLYDRKEIGQASVMYADGRLYCQGHMGTVFLVDPKDGRAVGQFAIAGIKEQMWAHPVVSDGKLYVRHGSAVSVYDIRASKAAGGQ